MPEISVLLAVDHDITRAGLRCLLSEQSEINIVGEASDLATAVEMTHGMAPNVVLLKLNISKEQLTEAARKICGASPGTRILLMDVECKQFDVWQFLACGIHGLCRLDSCVSSLRMAILAVADAGIWIGPEIVKVDYLNPKQIGSRPDLQSCGLSDRERQVLRLLVEGLSNQQIGASLHVSPETVKSHMRHIMQKLLVEGRTQAAVKAIREGLLSG